MLGSHRVSPDDKIDDSGGIRGSIRGCIRGSVDGMTALLGSHRVSPDHGVCIRSIGVLGGVLGAGGVDRVI